MSRSGLSEDTALTNAVMDAYRDVIHDRYQYENLVQSFELPEGVDKEMVDSIRAYFLDYVYPSSQDRQMLTEGFNSLKGYVSQPARMFSILSNLTGPVLKLGFFIPKAIKAAFNSLEAYNSAKVIEKELTLAAKSMGLKPPISKEKAINCVGHISKDKVMDFSEQIATLFNSFIDEALLLKTIILLDEVAAFIKRNLGEYSEKELNALIMGKSIITQGFELLSRYDSKLKKTLVSTVYEIEIKCFEDIYGGFKNSHN